MTGTKCKCAECEAMFQPWCPLSRLRNDYQRIGDKLDEAYATIKQLRKDLGEMEELVSAHLQWGNKERRKHRGGAK